MVKGEKRQTVTNCKNKNFEENKCCFFCFVIGFCFCFVFFVTFIYLLPD